MLVQDPGNSYKWIAGYANLSFYVRTASGVTNTPAISFDYHQPIHLIYLYNKNAGNRLQVFLNGKLRATATGYPEDIVPSTGNLQIGGHYTGPNNGFEGKIHEIRIYNRALSDTEIDRHFRGLTPSKSGLVLWHKYTKQTGTTVPDLSGNGNDGTVYGAEWTRREPVR